MPAPRFVHLRLHSEYSVTDGIVRIDDAVSSAAGGRHAGAGADRPRPICSAWSSSTARRAPRASSRSSAPTAGCRTRPTATSRSACCCCAQSRAGYLRLCDLLSRAWLQQPAPRPRRDLARPGCEEQRHRGPDRAFRRGRRRRRAGAAGATTPKRPSARARLGARCFPAATTSSCSAPG